jgi:hypothetical protein
VIVDEFYDDLFSYISYFSDPFSCDVRGIVERGIFTQLAAIPVIFFPPISLQQRNLLQLHIVHRWSQ